MFKAFAILFCGYFVFAADAQAASKALVNAHLQMTVVDARTGTALFQIDWSLRRNGTCVGTESTSGRSVRRRGAWHYSERQGSGELRIAELDPARTWRGRVVFKEVSAGRITGSLIDDTGNELGHVRGSIGLAP